jgi:rare lipoprotein A
MVTRKLGFLVLTGSLVLSLSSIAEAKHRHRKGHHSAQTSTSSHSGMASVYNMRSRTASGERCNPAHLTAAHKSLPFGTMVRVTNRQNSKSVVVRINDRGPFVRGRVIDLTPAGARAIGFSGLAPVSLSVVGRS